MMEAGYIMPSENPGKAIDAVSRGVFGMEAAQEVFYNLVVNHKPTLISP
jgi:hypothetical protein